MSGFGVWADDLLEAMARLSQPGAGSREAVWPESSELPGSQCEVSIGTVADDVRGCLASVEAIVEELRQGLRTTAVGYDGTDADVGLGLDRAV